jgi:hypothetical protein
VVRQNARRRKSGLTERKPIREKKELVYPFGKEVNCAGKIRPETPAARAATNADYSAWIGNYEH